MKAAVLTKEGLVIEDVPKPEPNQNEVLVRVRASGLNRADLMMAAGQPHGKLGGSGAIAGLEWAGEVAAVGAAVSEFKSGDRVMCSGAGGYAEYAKTDWGRVCPIPTSDFSYTESAALPIALQTMHNAIVTNGQLTQGENVLVQGASSGVGLMALQIARHKGASIVIGTSRDAKRRAMLAEFGADISIDPTADDWVAKIRNATNDRGVELVIDQVSGPTANQNMEATAVLGRIVNVGRLGGFAGEFDFDLHALKRIQYIGVTFRTRSIEEIRAINTTMREDIWEAVETRALRIPVDSTFSLDQATDAQHHMKQNSHFGKIVLTI